MNRKKEENGQKRKEIDKKWIEKLKKEKKVNKSCEIEQKRKENGQKKRMEMDRNE